MSCWSQALLSAPPPICADVTPAAVPARVALVMSYPYEAARGGEDSYVAALRNFIVQRGHRVDTLITDVTRGRSNPILSLPPGIAEAGALRMRRTLRFGRERHVSLDPALGLQSIRAAAGRPAAPDDNDRPGERAWLLDAIGRGRYDATILMWDASRHAAAVAPLCGRVLALKAFCVEHKFRLGEAAAVAIPERVVSELADAPLIGMNNLAEAQAVQRLLPSSKVIQVNMGFVDRSGAPDSREPFVLFVGANSGANRHSLDWLMENVWPRIAAERPDARLRIAGSVGSSWQGPVPRSVDILGRVPSLDDEYRRAQVVVAPLTNGTAGVKIKVAEALSFARPLVSTSLGVDPGAPEQFGPAVDVADDAGKFAGFVSRLLGDTALREQRGVQAKAAFQANFSGQAAYGALFEHLAL